MKKYLLFFLTVICSAVSFGQSVLNDVDYNALEKKHQEFLKWKFGIFLHFNMATYYNVEWATGYEDPLAFNPKKLDCDQWMREAKNAGMNYAVLTVKHTGGWCLWDSDYTTHDIASMKNFKKGKGDVVKEFVDACHRNNMKVGFYYCLPGDFSEGRLAKDQKDLHGLPPEAQGNYEEFIENQIKELFTRYGKIDIFFADQYANPYTPNHWRKLKKIISDIQPNCIVVANNAKDYKDTDIKGYEFPWLTRKGRNGLPPEGNKEATEVNDCIVEDAAIWFWRPDDQVRLQSAKLIINKLRYCNSNCSNYLLNVQPDRDGLISGNYLKTLREVASMNK